MQVAGPRVVAEAFPQFHDFGLGCGGERGEVRQLAEPAVEVGEHRHNLRLLQHELRHYRPVKRRVGAPRQLPLMHTIPGVQGGLEGGTLGNEFRRIGHEKHEKTQKRGEGNHQWDSSRDESYEVSGD